MAERFVQALHETFQRHSARRALVHERRTFTYGDLLGRAQDGAGWLQALGVTQGDRVVLCTSNKPAFLLAHLATLFAGAITVPLNPRFTREEFRFYLADSGARIAIVGDEAAPILEALRPELPDLQALMPDEAVLKFPSAAAHHAPVTTYHS